MRSKLMIEADIKLLSGLHIGTGMMSDASDAGVLRDYQGNPYIPGSSLKGVFRTTAEQLYDYTKQEDAVHKPVCFLESHAQEAQGDCNSSPALREKINQLQDRKYTNKENTASLEAQIEEAVNEGVCPICFLFGSVFKASKLTFSDSYLIEGQEAEPEVRHNTAIDRKTGTAKDGARFDYEVVPSSASPMFTVKIEAEDVQEDELRVLLAVLNEFTNGRVALGGKTTRGLGQVKFENIFINKYDFSNNQPEEKANYLRHILGVEKTDKKKDLKTMIAETFAV